MAIDCGRNWGGWNMLCRELQSAHLFTRRDYNKSHWVFIFTNPGGAVIGLLKLCRFIPLSPIPLQASSFTVLILLPFPTARLFCTTINMMWMKLPGNGSPALLKDICSSHYPPPKNIIKVNISALTQLLAESWSKTAECWMTAPQHWRQANSAIYTPHATVQAV